MKPETSGLLEEFDMLEQMRRELGETRMQKVTDMSLRDSMITEYKLLAGSSLQLLNMLERYGFIYKLSEDDLNSYQRILLQLAQSGCRCQDFVEQSQTIDQEALLASIPSTATMAN